MDDFAYYGFETFHCNHCHRLVVTIEAQTPDWQDALLYAHLAFNCRTDPYAGITGTHMEEL